MTWLEALVGALIGVALFTIFVLFMVGVAML